MDTFKDQNEQGLDSSSEVLMEALERLGVTEISPATLSQSVLGETLLNEAQEIIDEKLIH